MFEITKNLGIKQGKEQQKKTTKSRVKKEKVDNRKEELEKLKIETNSDWCKTILKNRHPILPKEIQNIINNSTISTISTGKVTTIDILPNYKMIISINRDGDTDYTMWENKTEIFYYTTKKNEYNG